VTHEELPPRVGHILRLAEIIREVDGNHDKGAAALAEAILSHSDICSTGLAAPSNPSLVNHSLSNLPITFTVMRSKYIEERWRRYFVFGSYADSPMVDISDGETYTVATMSREHAQTVISERDRLIDTLCQMALAFESAAPAQFEAFMAPLWEVASNPLVRPENHPTTTQEEIQ
jgi:hypothetical protein